MITHFQWKSLYGNGELPGWSFSFFYNKQRYTGIYHKNGQIEWTGPEPDDSQTVAKQIHELMLYHVYES